MRERIQELPLAGLSPDGRDTRRTLGSDLAQRGDPESAAGGSGLLRTALGLRRIPALVALASFVAFSVHAQATQSKAPSPSTNVDTQQLTLWPQNPVAPVTVFNATPSLPGATTFYYWVVSHDGSGNVGAPSGPFTVQMNAAPSVSYPDALTWVNPPGVVTVDILRTTTGNDPTGSCVCAVATGLAASVLSDTVSPTTAYTVATSANQLPFVITNTNANGTPASATNAIYATSFGLPATGYYSCVANWSNSSQTVTTDAATDTPFSQVMVGWQVFGTNGPCQFTNGSTIGTVEFQGTITAVNGPNSVNISVTPSATCAGSQSSHVSCRMYWVPSDSATALNTAWKAATSTRGTCPVLILPSGVYKFNAPIISTGNCGPILGLATGVAYNGPSVTGQSMSSTILVADPSFNASTCTPGCVFALSSNSTVQSLTIQNMTISGGGNATVTNGANMCKVSNGPWPGNIQDVQLDYWGHGTANFYGLCWSGTGQGMSYVKNVNVYNGGNHCAQIGEDTTVDGLMCFTPAGSVIGANQGTNITIIGSTFDAGASGGFDATIGTGACSSTNQPITIIGSQFTGSTNNGAIQDISACPLVLLGNTLNSTAGVNLAVGSSGNGAVATVTAQGNNFSGSVTDIGPGLNGVVGSKYIDAGGNIYSGPNALTSSLGVVVNWVADGHQLSGSCTGTATASSTLGLYGTGPNETTTTCTSTTIGSGLTISGAARILQNLVVTATNAGVNASSGVVTVLKNGATTAITCTVGTGTFCSDGTHTVAVSPGDRISIQFTTQAADTLAGVNASVSW